MTQEEHGLDPLWEAMKLLEYEEAKLREIEWDLEELRATSNLRGVSSCLSNEDEDESAHGEIGCEDHIDSGP